MPQPITYTAEIPASQLLNPQEFEAVRAESYELEGEARLANLRELVSGTMLRGQSPDGEPLSLVDEILDQVTDSPDSRSESEAKLEDLKQRARHSASSRGHEPEAATTSYVFTIDGNGTLVDMAKNIIVQQDTRRTRAAQRSAQKIGYGPKQNWTSGHGQISKDYNPRPSSGQ